jgi:hypothetical protein
MLPAVCMHLWGDMLRILVSVMRSVLRSHKTCAAVKGEPHCRTQYTAYSLVLGVMRADWKTQKFSLLCQMKGNVYTLLCCPSCVLKPIRKARA